MVGIGNNGSFIALHGLLNYHAHLTQPTQSMYGQGGGGSERVCIPWHIMLLLNVGTEYVVQVDGGN